MHVFLKNTANEIAPMLTRLFQLSLRTGVLPAVWKQAYVTPIYKTGERTDGKNYCPMSLTSIICKTMEHIVYSHSMHHLDTHNILLDAQFGFRCHHSCESQLLLTTNDFARAITIDNKSTLASLTSPRVLTRSLILGGKEV